MIAACSGLGVLSRNRQLCAVRFATPKRFAAFASPTNLMYVIKSIRDIRTRVVYVLQPLSYTISLWTEFPL